MPGVVAEPRYHDGTLLIAVHVQTSAMVGYGTELREALLPSNLTRECSLRMQCNAMHMHTACKVRCGCWCVLVCYECHYCGAWVLGSLIINETANNKNYFVRGKQVQVLVWLAQ